MTHSDSEAWRLVRAAASVVRRAGASPQNGCHYALDGETLTPVTANGATGVLCWDGGWKSLLAAPDQRQACLDLYLPLAGLPATRPFVIGQLGQSIDGSIATASGQSHYVTGEASILHLHRLRALSDCVIVGAGTVAADNPRLTTRLVSGDNPVRVVLDPQLRLPPTHHVFSDGQAPTLRVRAQGVALPPGRFSANVEDIDLPAPAGKLDLGALLAELQSRGHRSILVEGGGVTVSAFLAAGLLDRLHIAVAPFIMGEGRPGVRVPSPARLQDCLRPAPRIYALGEDVLFDCDLRGTDRQSDPADVSRVIRRLL
ncbi:MAG TPA: RibD family protein [Steroidobacteraceae bacterium]|jgi:riboflavin-specific deaminase-like protein